MEHKTADRYVDTSLGFPVTLVDVPMKEVRGDWIPDLYLNEFQQVVLWILAHMDAPMSGQQVRFVRHWMEKTQEAFADMHDVSHVAVSKWEAKGEQPTAMTKATEVLLRLNILTELPETVWDRLSGPNTGASKPESLKHLLGQIGRFETGAAGDREVTVPAGEVVRSRQLPLR
jgi:DNA-binding transcriptional regulator YiaG